MQEPPPSTVSHQPDVSAGRSTAWISSDSIGRWKIFVFALSLISLVAATYFALSQHAPPQFAGPVSLSSWGWWFQPHERNRVLRPPATTQNLFSVSFVSPQLGWAVGENGTILHTDDGGSSWNSQVGNTSDVLWSVVFVTPQSGWIVGDKGTILHTEDGGKRWHAQDGKTSVRLFSAAFVTPQSGWIVGDKGTILHTEDGGKSWIHQSSPTDWDLHSLSFVTPQLGWVVGGSAKILHTEDGGKNWKLQGTDANSGLEVEKFHNLEGVSFVTPQLGWVVDNFGNILHTDDGGNTWRLQADSDQSPSLQGSRTNFGLHSLTFITPQLGWAVGNDGILHTEDGGKSWNPQTNTVLPPLYSVAFTTPEVGWAVGIAGTVLRTKDGGKTWTPQSNNERRGLNAVIFDSPRTGWIVGAEGMILHTEDAGKNWVPQVSSTNLTLFGATFVSSQLGWVVGERGTILHTEDGGKNWSAQISNKDLELRAVAFVTPQSGWIMGEEGTILHTENGGKSWNSQASETRDDLCSVTFVGPQSGWAVGMEGVILHTEDGGKNWLPQTSGTHELLWSVVFVTPQSGWTVGTRGTILHTEDGGKTWTPESNTREWLYSVAFTTPQLGWIVGSNGAILRTKDGGKNWIPESNTSEWLSSVVSTTQQSGWVVGSNATILHTEDGGNSWNSLSYRRWLAPWFYLAVLFCCIGLVWACWPWTPPSRPAIEELANSDSPVTTLKDDSLGYRPLVERLRRFIQNPRTAPPLVLSVQAPWGMGKSSIMRMLESELRAKRAAITVWFNAWHHQKEDQLLACLMEAVQKQAVPSWFTPIGISFRLDLLRVRFFSNMDRAIVTLLTLTGIATGPYWWGFLPGSIKGAPHWAESLGIATVAWILLQPLLAFRSDPEKLMEGANRSVLRTLREFLTLPSLIGRSDVRREFAANLKDVVDALDPQRLVIFLDDLDRCRPDQVVQILEATNFLSSVSSCFIFIGADYRKVEALVAKEFEEIAVHEDENNRASNNEKPMVSAPADKVVLRLKYARNYMRKIINLRINLKHLEATDYKEFLRRKPQEARKRQVLMQRTMIVTAFLALLGCYVAVSMYPPKNDQAVASATSSVLPQQVAYEKAAPLTGRTTSSTAVTASPPAVQDSADLPDAGADEPPKSAKVLAPFDRDSIGFEGKWLAIGISSAIAFVFLVYWFSRPKRQAEAQDPTTFAEALEARSEDILKKCGTPREVRRFLNYLRLVAAPNDEPSREGIQQLRQKIRSFDAQLVELATTGASNDAGLGDVASFYLKQCAIFGIDPNTFLPLE